MDHLELRGIRKVFDGCVANDLVHLKIQKASIHGIIGENGAGKSTAMKMLYGIYPPNSGEILVNGKSVNWRSPADAIQAGIGMVHQHFMLARPMTVLENLLLEAEKPKFFLLPFQKKKIRAVLEKIMARYALPVPLDSLIDELPVGMQQRVEILKLLYKNCDILILDEPTAVLTPQETSEFFVQLRRLRDEGRTILIITHKLKEIMAVADRVTVFRAGRTVAEFEVKNTSAAELGEAMVGYRVDTQKLRDQIHQISEKIVFKGNQLSSPPKLESMDLIIRSGEVVGIAGVEGNGQVELQKLILASQRSFGMGYLPEDRIRQGMIGERPLYENFLLGHQEQNEFQRHGILNFKKIREACLNGLKKFDVKPLNVDAIAKSLSGGNQQKLVVARELWHEPNLILAVHPTRGVDLGASHFIHSEIRKSCARGAGVLLISSDLDELMNLSDRILVLYRGQVHAELSRREFDERKIGIAMGGGAL